MGRSRGSQVTSMHQPQRPAGRAAEFAAGEDTDRLEAERAAVAGVAARRLPGAPGHHVDAPLLAEGINPHPGPIQHLVQRLPERRLVEIDLQLRVGEGLAPFLADVDNPVAALLLPLRQNLR